MVVRAGDGHNDDMHAIHAIHAQSFFGGVYTEGSLLETCAILLFTTIY